MSVSTPDAVVQATFAATLVDEWVRCGVRHAVVSPGSRSAPLALALAAHDGIELHVRIDERSAGFLALGIAKATGIPAIVCTTSGTAAVELHPAVVEAHHAGVPMLACTADRPPELHGVGASQTIDQTHLFGTAVRHFFDPGVPCADDADSWRSLAATAYRSAENGPVQINLAFREPLLAEPDTLPPLLPGTPPRPADPGTPHPRQKEWADANGIILAGAGTPPGALELSERLGWPLLADPRSGCRVHHPNVIAAADAIVRANPTIRPDVVIRVGEPWVAKSIAPFLDGAFVIALDPQFVDPERVVTEFVPDDPAAWFAAQDAVHGTSPLLERWRAADAAVQSHMDAWFADAVFSEPLIARLLLPALPSDTAVMVSSSMPVRDLESFSPKLEMPRRVFANRGASGIDGVTSTAVGIALGIGAHVVAYVGDLAFFHDLSAFVRTIDDPDRIRVTVLVADNGGGGIFSLLPIAQVDPARFERLFGTPLAPDVLQTAHGLGIESVAVSTADELLGALSVVPDPAGIRVICAKVPDRAENARIHAVLGSL